MTIRNILHHAERCIAAGKGRQAGLLLELGQARIALARARGAYRAQRQLARVLPAMLRWLEREGPELWREGEEPVTTGFAYAHEDAARRGAELVTAAGPVDYAGETRAAHDIVEKLLAQFRAAGRLLPGESPAQDVELDGYIREARAAIAELVEAGRHSGEE